MNWLFLLAEAVSTKEWAVRLIADYSYLGVFLFLLACGLGFPAPEEVALIGGGYAVYEMGGGWPQVLLMVAVAMTGVLTGDVALWWIGRRVGNHPEKVPIIGRHLTRPRMRRARALFRKHGAKAVFFGRFLFGIRAVTFFVSGSLRVPLSTFVLMDGLAALLTVPASVILAWHFGGELQQVFSWIGRLDRVILLVVSIAVLAAGYTIWRRSSKGPPPPAPDDSELDGPGSGPGSGVDPAQSASEVAGPAGAAPARVVADRAAIAPVDPERGEGR